MTSYEKLYNNLKIKLTVVDGEEELTVGECLRKNADNSLVKTETVLPAVKSNSAHTALVSFISYINDKLTVKKPAIKDKTIRAFPFRTSIAAFLSAVLMCAIVLTFGSKTLNNPTASPVGVIEMINTNDNNAASAFEYTA